MVRSGGYLMGASGVEKSKNSKKVGKLLDQGRDDGFAWEERVLKFSLDGEYATEEHHFEFVDYYACRHQVRHTPHQKQTERGQGTDLLCTAVFFYNFVNIEFLRIFNKIPTQ